MTKIINSNTQRVLPCLQPTKPQHDKEFEKFDTLVNRLFTEIMLEFYKEQNRKNNLNNQQQG
jgi:hypothetical protein